MVQLGGEGFYAAVVSPLAKYVAEVDREEIRLLTEPEIGLNWGPFCQAYGWLILVFLYVPAFAYKRYKTHMKK